MGNNPSNPSGEGGFGGHEGAVPVETGLSHTPIAAGAPSVKAGSVPPAPVVGLAPAASVSQHAQRSPQRSGVPVNAQTSQKQNGAEISSLQLPPPPSGGLVAAARAQPSDAAAALPQLPQAAAARPQQQATLTPAQIAQGASDLPPFSLIPGPAAVAAAAVAAAAGSSTAKKRARVSKKSKNADDYIMGDADSDGGNNDSMMDLQEDQQEYVPPQQHNNQQQQQQQQQMPESAPEQNYDGEDDFLDEERPPKHIPQKRKRKPFIKAPGAPVSGRSAYVLFSLAVRESVKDSLPEGYKVTEIMKKTSSMWREMPDAEKGEWRQKALDDKRRYEAELQTYSGPLKIANVKVKKDPHLPKKAKSAYVWFAEETRPRLKTQFPDSKPTAISKLMGDQWNIMTQEEKAPYNQKAADDAIRFKDEMDRYVPPNPKTILPALKEPAEVPEGAFLSVIRAAELRSIEEANKNGGCVPESIAVPRDTRRRGPKTKRLKLQEAQQLQERIAAHNAATAAAAAAGTVPPTTPAATTGATAVAAAATNDDEEEDEDDDGAADDDDDDDGYRSG